MTHADMENKMRSELYGDGTPREGSIYMYIHIYFTYDHPKSELEAKEMTKYLRYSYPPQYVQGLMDEKANPDVIILI
jgi:hypothetical protein